ELGFPNSEIRYTTNGTAVEPNSQIYNDPIKLNHTATIKAKVFHHDFKSSEQSTLQITQIANNISDATIKLEPQANENYKGLGAAGLIDGQKGSLQFRSGREWIGFQTSPVTITIDLKNSIDLSLLKVSCLQNQGAWIFAPKKITVFSDSEQVGEVTIENASNNQENQLKIIPVPIENGTYSKLKIMVYSLSEIPQWHQGKGTLPWLFLDEILVE
ncbi:MAG: chitobiase/beta-hexosaminidase C-terminal domain-containing protein, partial [Maribacter sp.]